MMQAKRPLKEDTKTVPLLGSSRATIDASENTESLSAYASVDV
jgi:hypothetical protein